MKTRGIVKDFISDLLRDGAIRLALRIIRHYGSGKAVGHFRKEADIAWKKGEAKNKGDYMQTYIVEQVCDILRLISIQNHSGYSVGVVCSLISKALRFDILSPLTFSDEEFENRDGYYQNRRLCRVFRTSENGVTWYRDIDCIDYSEELVYDYGKREITNGNKETWNGLIYLLDSGGHIYPSNKIQIKNTEDFLGDNKCTVKALRVVNFLKGAPGFSIRVANEDALPKEWHMDYEIRPADESYNKDVIGFLQDHNLYEMYRRNVDY